MTLKSPNTVIIEKPAPSLGDIMGDIRTWLDNRKIAPAEFKTMPTETGFVAVEIRFATQDEACLFEQTFA